MTVYNFFEEIIAKNIYVDSDTLHVYLINADSGIANVYPIPIPDYILTAFSLDPTPDLNKQDKHFETLMHDAEVTSVYWSFEQNETTVHIFYLINHTEVTNHEKRS